MKEEQRPLFTIGILVCGVVGGLTVVISVVYLYRFCLKKRNPVTTTGNPDFKREHIRSVVVGLSRPLPLPPEFITTSTPKHTSTTTLAYEDDHEIETGRSMVPLVVSNDSNYALRLSQNTYNTLLSVSPAPTSRAHSAEFLPPGSGDDVHRGSFDVQRGIGRQLPSTEGLESQQHHLRHLEHERQRRMSHFARSNAVQYAAPPRKQVSSPLPDQSRRIYERGHAHSRSWNPGAAQPSPPPPLTNPNPYRFYETLNPQESRETAPRIIQVPIINEPPSPTPITVTNQDGERRRSMVQRQAKSFENPRSAAAQFAAFAHHRSYTINEQQRSAEIEKREVSAACQSLWAAKGHLEQLDALGISEPSSVSTSFESNTDSQVTCETGEKKAIGNSAKGKRQQYKSLLLQRQFLSTTATTSFDESTNSTTTDNESDAIMFASSMDSARSELERRRLSLMNHRPHLQQQQQPLLQQQHREGNNSSDEAVANMQQQQQRMTARDYSVDATSDSLFREWSRVDPAYDPLDRRLQRGHTLDHTVIHHPRHFQRQFSLVTPPSPISEMRRQTIVSYRDS